MTQTTQAPAKSRAQITARTLRKDQWKRAPRITAVLLTIWVAYATVRVFMGHWYWVPQYHYLTPFYSPCVSGECVQGSASLGTWFGKVPPIIPYAIVSLPFCSASGSPATTTAGLTTGPSGARPPPARYASRTPGTPARPGCR